LGKYKNKFTFVAIIKGCFSKNAKAEIIPDEPDPGNAGVGKRNLQLFTKALITLF